MSIQTRTNRMPILLWGVLLVFSIFIGVGGGSMFGLISLQSGVFCTGVTVDGIMIGNMTREQALDVLQEKCSDHDLQRDFLFVHQGRNWVLPVRDFALQYDWETVLDEAFTAGRKGNYFQKIQERYQVKTKGKNFPLTYRYDKKKLLAYFNQMNKEIEIKPVSAQLLIDGENTVTIKPEITGKKIDFQKLMEIMDEKIVQGDRLVELPIEENIPEITQSILEERGIKTFLASSTSAYSGKKTNRSYNIDIAAKAIDGLLLAPDEIFSFNKIVGPRSQEAGYKNAGVIVNNEVVDGIGGGVCQVSSTLYNAILLSNLQIVQRTNHSRPVSYYPLGQDATVAYDYLDFKFKNNTDHYILLKAAANNGLVTVRVFGYAEPGDVQITNQIVSTKPGTSQTIFDSTLTTGRRIIEKSALSGYVVETWRKCGDQKELVSRSNYNAVNGVVRVGTAKAKIKVKKQEQRESLPEIEVPSKPKEIPE